MLVAQYKSHPNQTVHILNALGDLKK